MCSFEVNIAIKNRIGFIFLSTWNNFETLNEQKKTI